LRCSDAAACRRQTGPPGWLAGRAGHRISTRGIIALPKSTGRQVLSLTVLVLPFTFTLAIPLSREDSLDYI